jgi:hypothetical protein
LVAGKRSPDEGVLKMTCTRFASLFLAVCVMTLVSSEMNVWAGAQPPVAPDTTAVAVIEIEICDVFGQPIEGATVIIGAGSMPYRRKPLASGVSPYQITIGEAGRWAVHVTDYVYDTVLSYVAEGDAGSHTITWDGTDSTGHEVEDGVYRVFYQTESEDCYLGEWAIWNYSEITVTSPLLFLKDRPARFRVENFSARPDTLGVFYDFSTYYLPVMNPYFAYCVRDGYRQQS